jgi:hypothetical protein
MSGRSRKTALAPFSALLLAAAPAAHAELVEIVWKDGGRFERSLTVAPGKFAEACGPLRQGQAVMWSFDAPAPLNFNIHYHVDKDVHYPARQDQVGSLKGELAVAAAQDYCWMWTNKSSKPVRLDLSLALK